MNGTRLNWIASRDTNETRTEVLLPGWSVPEQDKFKYVDDLRDLELVKTKENLIEHFPSYLAVGE